MNFNIEYNSVKFEWFINEIFGFNGWKRFNFKININLSVDVIVKSEDK